MPTSITLAIIGLDRLGTSLGLALKRYAKTPNASYQFTILGYDESSENRQTAKTLGAIDQEVATPEQAVSQAALILQTIHPGAQTDLYTIAGGSVQPGAVIVDFGPSASRTLALATQHLPKNPQGQPLAYVISAAAIINPALLHEPLNGIAAARADLLDNGGLSLAPMPDCHPDAVQLAADLGGLLGVPIKFADPLEQEGMIAAMEGLPLLAALGLFQMTAHSAGWDDLRQLGNPLFVLETIGLSQRSPDDPAAFFAGDRDRAVRALTAYIENLQVIRELLQADDRTQLNSAFARAVTGRDEWLTARRARNWEAKTTVTPTEKISFMGVLGARFLPGPLRPGAKGDTK